jgi:hypothetical protein
MPVLTGTEISHSNDQTEMGAKTVSTTLACTKSNRDARIIIKKSFNVLNLFN